jgi:hypothetical protein
VLVRVDVTALRSCNEGGRDGSPALLCHCTWIVDSDEIRIERDSLRHLHDGGEEFGMSVFVLFANEPVAAGQTAVSAPIELEGLARSVCLISSVNQNASRDVQVSDDGETWYNVMTAGSIYPSVGLITTGTSNAAVILDPGGARYLRIRATNSSASPMTVNGKAMVAWQHALTVRGR